MLFKKVIPSVGLMALALINTTFLTNVAQAQVGQVGGDFIIANFTSFSVDVYVVNDENGNNGDRTSQVIIDYLQQTDAIASTKNDLGRQGSVDYLIKGKKTYVSAGDWGSKPFFSAFGPAQTNLYLTLKLQPQHKQFWCRFNLILSFMPVVNLYYENIQVIPGTNRNTSYPYNPPVPKCVSSPSGPWSSVGFLGGYFSIQYPVPNN
ncbi:MAG: hypothetical protein J6P29_04000 [Acetobacter sp.]|nr:hypothetical protein [Acetobacter sp.]